MLYYKREATGVHMKIFLSIKRLPFYQLFISILIAIVVMFITNSLIINKAIKNVTNQIRTKEFTDTKRQLRQRIWLITNFLKATSHHNRHRKHYRVPSDKRRKTNRRLQHPNAKTIQNIKKLLLEIQPSKNEFLFAGTINGRLLPSSYMPPRPSHVSPIITKEIIIKKIIPKKEKGYFFTSSIQRSPSENKEKVLFFATWIASDNLFIGTGITIASIEKRISKTLEPTIVKRKTAQPMIFLIIAFISFITSLILYSMIRLILRDFRSIHSFLRRINMGIDPISTRKLKFKEFKMLALDANWMIRKLRRFTHNLEKMLDEKGLLLKEIHHRVKNNFQVVSSIISIQSSQISNPQINEILNKCDRRIRSIALAHEKIYNSTDFTNVNFEEYTSTLMLMLTQSHPEHAGRVVYDICETELPLPLEKAIPCALILNELAENAFQHAFKNKTAGTITIDFNITEKNECCISVSDTGCGIPDSIDPLIAESLGFTLTRLLISQLRGEIHVSREKGTSITFCFPE